MKKSTLLKTLISQATLEISKNNFDSAKALLQKASLEFPDNAEIFFLLGILAYANTSYDKAIDYFKKSDHFGPDNPKTLYNYATVLLDIGRYSDALKLFNTVLSLAPDHVPTINKCSNILGKMGFTSLAERLCRYALTKDPSNLDAHLNLANSLREQGAIEEALTWYQKALAINPDDDLASSSYLLCLNYSHHTQQTIFDKHRHWGQKKENSIRVKKAISPSPLSGRKLRVGYVSEDFRTHSVGYFIEPIITCHDKSRCEIFCYSNASSVDETTARIKNHASFWRSISGIGDEKACSMIREDAIDILVDCAGHTGNNRLALFCMKPAPIQVTYLGYPNTTGISRIDYRLTDRWADPEDQNRYYTEKLYRLPDGFLCYRPPQSFPPTTDPPARTNGFITFGSFNNLPKINEQVIKTWARILHALPDARLNLKTKQFNDKKIIDRLKKYFNTYGIEEKRLLFHGYSLSREEHLNAYNRIDIALDTFPYNGTTTTCEALFMGVPVIALAGDRHAGRVGVSILSQTGLTCYLAQTEEEYVAKAVALSGDITNDGIIRKQLRETCMDSPLCNGNIFTRALEDAYHEMATKVS